MLKKQKKVLVLGADGFIGSHLTEALVQKGFSIRVFDLFKDGKSKNLEHLKEKIEFFSGNFLNQADISQAIEGCMYVFHFISLTTPASSMNDPLIDIDGNIKGSVNLLQRCVEAKVKRVIFASSGGSIYGNQDEASFSENDPVFPISPYAISKLAIERYLEYFRIEYGLDYLSLRYANPYGPGQNIVGSQGIVPIFLNLIKQDNPLSIFGDGDNVRDYIYIDDLADATVAIFNKETSQRVFNIGSNKGVSINELVTLMKKVTVKNIITKMVPSRGIDVRRIVLNTKKIEKEIGIISKVSLEEGIAKTWRWIQQL